MNLKNLMMWGVIVLLVAGLFQLFQNPKNPVIADKLPFSDFLKNVEAGRVIQVEITGNNIEGILSSFGAAVIVTPFDVNFSTRFGSFGV